MVTSPGLVEPLSCVRFSDLTPGTLTPGTLYLDWPQEAINNIALEFF